MISFRDVARFIFGRLPWAGGDYGRRFVECFGLIGDAMGEACLLGAMAVWTHNPEQPQDARGRLATERRMPRYPGESDGQHRARLSIWRAIYRNAGSEAVLTAELEAFGFTGVVIYTPFSGAPWSTMEPYPWESQFWLVVPDGSHEYGPPTTIGSSGAVCGVMRCGISNITAEEVTGVKALILRRKPSDWVCRWIRFGASAYIDI